MENKNVFLKGSRNYEIAELVNSNFGFYPSYPKTGSFDFPVNHTEKVWIAGVEIHVDGFGTIDIRTGKPMLNA